MQKLFIQAWCVISLLVATTAYAQSQNGSLTGKVTSADGSAIPSAAVTVTNTSTNVSQKVLTTGDGSFTVSTLPPGTYRVDVEIAGYKRTSQQNVVLPPGGPTAINITLQAGSTTETVEIEGHAPAVQTQSGEVSMGVNERTLRELPVIDRNHQQLVELQTGITPPAPAFDRITDPDRNRFFSADGQSPAVNEWQADGVWNTEPFRATAVRVPSVETIRQLNVETNNLTASQGFAGGAVSSSMSSSGSNGIHGSLYEFYSGDTLRSRDFFDHAPNTSMPRFVSNQFGATVGGPIIKDKTFFFGSYEGAYQSGHNTMLTTVPTPQALSGNFSGIPGVAIYNPFSGNSSGAGRTVFPGNMVPAFLLNRTSSAIASFLPSANLPGFVDNYVSNSPFASNTTRFDGRLDQHISDRTSAFVRWGYTNNWGSESSPLGDVIGSSQRTRVVAQNAVADVSHAITPAFITDFRFGYNRYDATINPFGSASPLGSALGLGGLNNLVGVNIQGMPGIGSPVFAGEHGVDNTFNWAWTFAYHKGMHDISFGTDIRRIRSDGFTEGLNGNQFGMFGSSYFGPGSTLASGIVPSGLGSTYNSLAGFLLGAPNQVGIVNTLTEPTIRQTEYSAWVGDRVNLMRRLTLDVGLRYEIYSPLEPANPGGAAFFDPNTNTFSYAGINGTAMHQSMYQTRNVAPRIGFAARVTDKTVVRGGYGIQYFQLPYMYSGFMPATFGSVIGTQGTYGVAPAGTFGPTFGANVAPPATLQNGTPAGNLPAAIFSRYQPTSSVQTFSLQVQQEFYWGTVLSAGYMGSLGRHLAGIEELNASLPGTGIAGQPGFGLGRSASTLLAENGLTNNYNSLQVRLSKRFSKGLSFVGAYTFAKALGYTSSDNRLLNPTNLASNYGPLDYDRQHVLSLSHVWEIPFGQHGNHIMTSILGGWQLNGIFSWASGTPLTITADPLACGCVGNTVFGNVLPGVNPVMENGASFLNPAAFTAPVNSFGNLGRGAIYGKGYRNYDLSVFKNFHVNDRFNLQLRGEAYNLTNSTHFANPVTNVNAADFGQSVSTLNGSFGRQLNVGARLLF